MAYFDDVRDSFVSQALHKCINGIVQARDEQRDLNKQGSLFSFFSFFSVSVLDIFHIPTENRTTIIDICLAWPKANQVVSLELRRRR